MTLTIRPVTGIGEVRPGDDLVALLAEALRDDPPQDGDVVVVTHKVVSKAEGAMADAPDEAARRRVVEAESMAVVRRRGELTIAVTRHGFVCANAGVDRSNVEPGKLVLLPRDPDRSAHRIRVRLERAFDVRLGVIITDTFGRPWRRGLTDVAIGISGIPAIVDYRGTRDTFGTELEVTEVAVADEIAAAADLVMGKATGVPAAVVSGVGLDAGEGRASDLVRPPDEDLFR